MFGPHLMMDCYGCNKRKLKDIEFIYNFLDTFPGLVGMTKIMPPYTFTYHGVKPEDWGISGVVLIAESHISIHTFPEKNYASVDIFSCKDFNVDDAVELIKSSLEVKKYEKNLLARGREFPKDIWKSKQVVSMLRERTTAEVKEEVKA
ncbi:S-adenosylmethionine decarboxylase proenzyme [Candidatus Gugararchaeum adminiculabundum]|nr:S-adenosylmethionine decarboxylase proenzyme [Candidatus Gugararchaeum adminiculabundum]